MVIGTVCERRTGQPRGERTPRHDRATHCAGGRILRDEIRFSIRSSRGICSRSAITSSERRLDASFYDLLASEARLASFVAIAQGKLPQEHWFALGGC